MAKDLKRSLTIAGHRTSVSLEPEFWNTLTDMAKADGKSLAGLIGEIDQQRKGRNLSASLRVYVLLRLTGKETAAPAENPAPVAQEALAAPEVPAAPEALAAPEEPAAPRQLPNA